MNKAQWLVLGAIAATAVNAPALPTNTELSPVAPTFRYDRSRHGFQKKWRYGKK